MPEVSVIIPNYNHAFYLKERIDSVLNQTFKDLEVIILDDLSSDNSREIIELYRDHPKVTQIVYNDVNSGSTFKQWKKGMNLAQGEFIWIAESDDWCEPSFLEHLVEAFKQNQNCVIAYCQSYCVKNNQILWQSSHQYLEEHLKGLAFIRSKMVTGNAIFNASMSLFRKKVIQSVSDKYTSFKFCGDWAFWIELARQGDVFISGRVLNYFRKHEKDVSGKAYKDGINFPEELSILSDLFKNKIIDKETFLLSLKEKYNRYKSIEGNISPENRHAAQLLFFTDKETKAFLVKPNSSSIFDTLKKLLK